VKLALVTALAVLAGCGGAETVTVEKSAEKPSIREKAREALAEEWGDEYHNCLRDDEYWGGNAPERRPGDKGFGYKYPGYPKVDAYMRKVCRETANEILP
jgi:hypothetical protein